MSRRKKPIWKRMGLSKPRNNIVQKQTRPIRLPPGLAEYVKANPELIKYLQ